MLQSGEAGVGDRASLESPDEADGVPLVHAAYLILSTALPLYALRRVLRRAYALLRMTWCRKWKLKQLCDLVDNGVVDTIRS